MYPTKNLYRAIANILSVSLWTLSCIELNSNHLISHFVNPILYSNHLCLHSFAHVHVFNTSYYYSKVKVLDST